MPSDKNDAKTILKSGLILPTWVGLVSDAIFFFVQNQSNENSYTHTCLFMSHVYDVNRTATI